MLVVDAGEVFEMTGIGEAVEIDELHDFRLVDDMPDEFREWMIDFGDSGYLVRYRIGSDAITILAVRHQREVGF